MEPRKGKILIIDDQENNRLVIEDILRKLRGEIRSVHSGPAALTLLEEWTPDLILMDHMMPEMSGIETTRILKQSPRFTHVPVLIVTAKNDRQTLQDAFAAGAVDYILKPVERVTLMARTNSALRTKHAFDQVHELTQDLLRQKQELTHFTHMVSHDLKSPVVGAASLFNLFLHRLQDEHPEVWSDPSMLELLQRVPNSFQKMLSFIDTLLNYAMSGKVIGEMQDTSLAQLLQSVLEQFDPAQRDGLVRFQLPKQDLSIYCDTLKMGQVWQNLIANAIRYRGATKPVLIRLDGRMRGDWYECWIEDNGPGVPAKERERIFLPFTRLHEAQKGSGIGLATVKKILEAHQGSVWLDTGFPHGARFVMRWPKKEVLLTTAAAQAKE
jgi:signal transduction histidine kinase